MMLFDSGFISVTLQVQMHVNSSVTKFVPVDYHQWIPAADDVRGRNVLPQSFNALTTGKNVLSACDGALKLRR